MTLIPLFVAAASTSSRYRIRVTTTRRTEQQQIPLFGLAEPFKVLSYPDGFSLVTSDSIFNAHAISISVVHDAGSLMNAPEWRSTQSVSSALNNPVEIGLLRSVNGCQMPRI